MRLPSSILVALLLLVPLHFAGTSQAAAATPAPKTVLLVGDSLSSAHRIPAEAGWVVLLQHRLDRATPAPPVIVNSSRGGKTLTDALQELPALLTAHRPQLVIFELGANDAILGANQQDLQRNMALLISRTKASGAKVAMLGFEIPPTLDKNDSAQTLRRAYAHIQQSQQIVLLPSLMDGISNDPALLLDDGVHPTAAAQARMLDNAWGTLRPLLLD